MYAAQRAVEVLYFCPDGENSTRRWTVGSGCLVGGRLVLTAAHNVGFAVLVGAAISIRCLDGREHPAVVLATGGTDGPDLAVLEVQGDGLLTAQELVPVRFGRVDRTRIGSVSGCWAIGFPRWKEQPRAAPSAPLRDSVQVEGVIPPASNLRRGLLELRTYSTPQPLSTALVDQSEWQGMSGAVVFAPGPDPHSSLAIGVVSEHHRPEGSSSLTVVPVTALAELGIGSSWWQQLNLGDWVEPLLSVAPRPVSVRPRNVRLNRPKSDFTDREAEMAQISALLTRDLAGSCPLVVIHGMGGVGKSELANQLAHRLGAVFHQARIRVDLGGSGLPEVSTEGALTQILHGFGRFGDRVPRDPEERLGLVRELLADGPCLLLLDNATHAVQVEPLLPTMPGSAVVITSRSPLKALDGVRRVHLEPLPEPEGLLLFERVRGEQPVPLDRAVGSRIVALLGGLPLAVRIAATAAASPAMRRRPLSHLEGLLEDEDRRLSLLEDEERTVRGIFDISYRSLRSDVARFFRWLGLLTASDFGAELVAHAVGLTVNQASELLDELAERQLVETTVAAGSRRQLHELVRLYARERAHREDSPQQRDAVLRRSLEWYADRVTELMAYPGAHERPPDAALAWFSEEHLNLRSTLRAARDACAWDLLSRLAGSSYGLLWYRGLWEELAAAQAWAVEAASEQGDVHAELGSLIHLAEACRALGRAPETPAMYERALDLARQLADEDKEGWVLTHYGDLQCDLGRPEEALRTHYAQALALYRRRRDEGAEIWLAAHIADACRQLRRPEEAAEVQRRALVVSRERGDAAEVAWCQWHLALALGEVGRFTEAEAALREAIAFHRRVRDLAGLATMLLALGRIHLAAGCRDKARDVLTEALASAQAVGVPHREEEILTELGRANESC